MNRRRFLARAGGGMGSLAFALLASEDASARGVLAPHFRPRARSVIHLFMHGGPSHVDLFDPKPVLARFAGQPLPESFGPVMTRRKVAANPLLGPVAPFRPRGASGVEVSDLLPEIGAMVDRIAVLRSCHGDSVNHPQSVYQINTGSILMGRPSLGSWVAYGLGSESRDLPAYVVLPDPGGAPKGGPPAWSSGYLPARYQGTLLRSGAEPVLDLAPARSVGAAAERRTLDFVRRMSEIHARDRDQGDELEARIRSYELAFRMQAAVPELVDISNESEATKRMYGIGEKDTDEFGVRCLLARRMIERGVRFVQLYSGDTNGWDAHSDVVQNHGTYCRRTDRAVAGLLRDLEERGLLDDTLVIWGGEFGRMPMSEQGKGRDHNPWGFTTWLAGGGVRGGVTYGETDDVGLRAEVNPVHVHDLHATILHLLGFDHERLTFLHAGREQRLTEVSGHVIREILA